MLTLRLKRRRLLFIILSILGLIFATTLAVVLYSGQQSIATITHDADTQAKSMDATIAKLKETAKKKRQAEEQAAQEAAARSAEAADTLAAQQAGQVVTPKNCAISGAHGDPTSVDVVINKKRCFSPIDFTPPDLSSYNGYVVSAKIIPDMTAMFTAASAAGVPLSLTSAYRSYGNQVTTYNHWVAMNGSTAAADTVSARPGYSEHQTGLVFDLSAGGCSLECFRGSAQYQWMLANAHQYGFIERYPIGLQAVTGYSPEAWHWRYVGIATATQMKTSGIKTLEQLWNLPGGSY
ncbi:MAG: M15 family metallopeptidase [Candidatus Saccharimonadales bacterium]